MKIDQAKTIFVECRADEINNFTKATNTFYRFILIIFVTNYLP